MKFAGLVILATAVAGTTACGDSGDANDNRSADARKIIDATTIGDCVFDSTSCTDSGSSSVTFDSGDGTPAQTFTSAWFNRGHQSKSCFEISLVLTSADELSYPLVDAVEVWFSAEPIIGNNSVRVIREGLELATPGNVNLTEFSESALSGTIHVVDGDTTIDGAVIANRCTAIYDPCL